MKIEAKLSKTQQNVIAKLNSGWSLYSGTGPDRHTWMSKGYEGYEFEHISSATLWALYKRKLIRFERKYPICRWYLVRSGEGR